MTLLNSVQLEDKLSVLNGWNVDKDQLCKEFTFKDFRESLDFVNKVGDIAEHLKHHPDILIHKYNKVKFCITTHDEGGLTDKDFLFAKQVDRIL